MAEPLAREAARRPRSSRARRPAAACVALALAGTWAALGGPGAADAARLVDVRVGRHADFVRVVFETDAPAAFSVEAGEAPEERRVRIEAEGGIGAVRVPPGAGAEVTLERLPDGATLARIRAAAPVRVESQVLDRPPRIVFDLRPGAPEPAPVAEPLAEEPPPAGYEEPPPAGYEEPAATEAATEPAEPGPVVLAPELREPAVLPDLAPPLAERAPEPWLAEGPPEEAPPPPPVEPGPGPAPERAPEPSSAEPAAPAELPPVAAAPPGAVVRRLEERSLLVGAAAGLAIGLGFSLLGRGRRREADGAAWAERADEPAPAEAPAVPAPAPAPERPPALPVESLAERAAAGALPSGDRLAEDVFAMLQRLDERFVRVEGTLAALVERTARLEARSGMQAEELATQRVALARLHLAVGPPAGVESGRRSATPGAAATAPARER